MARIKTKYTGVYYRESKTNGKVDKTYYITYKDNNNKMIETKIGKYSEGVREAYCNQKRNEIVTKLRLGEEPPAATKYKKKKINSFKDTAAKYFEQRKDNDTTKAYLAVCNLYIIPYFTDIDTINKNDIIKFKKFLQSTTLKNSNRKLSVKYINDVVLTLIEFMAYIKQKKLSVK